MAIQFRYQARDKNGNRVTGVIEAESSRSAVEALRREGLFVSAVTRETARKRFSLPTYRWPILPKRGRLPAMTLSLFCRQFGILIRTGIPIVESLRILSEQMRDPRLKEALDEVRMEVASGFTLAESMGRKEDVFPSLVVRLIEVGEAAGTLDEILSLLHSYYEREHEVQNRVKQAIRYPVFIVGIAFLVTFILFFFILPNFANVFSGFGVELSEMTRAALKVSYFLRAYWSLVLGSVALFAAGIRAFFRTPRGKRWLDGMVLRFPVVGDLVTKVIFSRCSRSLQLLVGSGIPLIEALRSSSQVTQNVLVREAMGRVRVAMEQGALMAAAMEKEPVFPSLLVHMLSVGEESGAMVETLSQVSAWYDREVEYAVKAMIGILEPVAIVVMTIVVLLIALSVVLPIFQLTTSITSL